MIQSFLSFLGKAPSDSMIVLWWLSYGLIGGFCFSLSVLLYRPRQDWLGAIIVGISLCSLLGPLGALIGPMCLILHCPAVRKEMGDYADDVAERIKRGIDP